MDSKCANCPNCPSGKNTNKTSQFTFQKIFDAAAPLDVPMRRLPELSSRLRSVDVDFGEGIKRTVLHVPPSVLTDLTEAAFHDVEHLLRSSHLQQLSDILKDREATDNDKFVALELLKNACVASGLVLPGCQDTGTAIIIAKKGVDVLVHGDEDDEAAMSRGVHQAFTKGNLRYSQMAPLDIYTEANTGNNLPAQIDIYADSSDGYKFLFIAKGGGSANKTLLFQQTRALLNPDSLMAFLKKTVTSIGTSACPPYHLAVVIGGLSAEMTLKTVKAASCRHLDNLHTSGNELGRGFRDIEMEAAVLKMTQEIGIGAQFGGKFFCHDVRVIRLPRHGASCPVGIGVSCSADRQAEAVINKDGVFLEELETDPAKFLPDIETGHLTAEEVKLDFDAPMADIRKALSKCPVKTRLSISGTLIVARDIAHARLYETLKNTGQLPSYFKDHAIYYAGPAKIPAGMVSGSFGPTTAGRMDTYLPEFMKAGASLVTLAKGNRGRDVAAACKNYGGFYLGSIGGPAAILARDCIVAVEDMDFPELGMEAVRKIQVKDFPAFVVIDDKGNDFYEQWG